MRIIDRLGRDKSSVSFEFFPPKTDAGAEHLFQVVQELQQLAPNFVSVTYGAGGSTRAKTREIVTRIKRETGIETMAHLTCVGHTKDELKQILDELLQADITNILALRGDLPKGQSQSRPAEGGLAYASELIHFIKELGAPVCIGGACYPESHPESEDPATDLEMLRLKVDAGAEFLITQLFFDNAYYYGFVERARNIGIQVPIIPGIMPITSYKQVHRFTHMCGAHIPATLFEELESVHGNMEAVAGLGISYAIDQCRDLRKHDTPGLHLYTLNKSSATRAIVARLRHDPESRHR
ncbi:MAG: methylenetetrahydrofolate reductase [NAD(P)H] [Planctomycetota bacterium]|nr:MAG: methylenetetrahydrofolate reductase [NAD(P)H] [Planctomycetota bacterium]